MVAKQARHKEPKDPADHGWWRDEELPFKDDEGIMPRNYIDTGKCYYCGTTKSDRVRIHKNVRHGSMTEQIVIWICKDGPCNDDN